MKCAGILKHKNMNFKNALLKCITEERPKLCLIVSSLSEGILNTLEIFAQCDVMRINLVTETQQFGS